MEKIKLISRLTNREMTAQEFIDYCKKIIVNLKITFPYLEVISTWDESTNSKFYFDNNLSNINGQNLKRILIYKEAEYVFLNDDQSDKDLYSNSKSWMGFNSLLYLSKNKKESSDLSINITQGACNSDKTALVNIEFSDDFIKSITKEFVIKLVESLEKTDDLYYAVIISNELRRKVKQSGQNLWIGYFTYFNNKLAENYFENINIINLSKGVLMYLSDKIELSALNVNKALEIRDILGNELLNYNP